MNVEPAPARTVRDPVTGCELTAVLDVPDGSPFWLRRVADGDVQIVGTGAGAIASMARALTFAPVGAVSQTKADTKGGSQ